MKMMITLHCLGWSLALLVSWPLSVTMFHGCSSQLTHLATNYNSNTYQYLLAIFFYNTECLVYYVFVLLLLQPKQMPICLSHQSTVFINVIKVPENSFQQYELRKTWGQLQKKLKPFSFLGISQPRGRVLSAMVGRGRLSEIIADNGDGVAPWPLLPVLGIKISQDHNSTASCQCRSSRILLYAFSNKGAASGKVKQCNASIFDLKLRL